MTYCEIWNGVSWRYGYNVLWSEPTYRKLKAGIEKLNATSCGDFSAKVGLKGPPYPIDAWDMSIANLF
jgi:hypothetical protein